MPTQSKPANVGGSRKIPVATYPKLFYEADTFALYTRKPEGTRNRKQFLCKGCGYEVRSWSKLLEHVAKNRWCPSTTKLAAYLTLGEEPELPLRWSNWNEFVSGEDDALKEDPEWKGRIQALRRTQEQVKPVQR